MRQPTCVRYRGGYCRLCGYRACLEVAPPPPDPAEASEWQRWIARVGLPATHDVRMAFSAGWRASILYDPLDQAEGK